MGVEITVLDDSKVSGWLQSVFRIGEIYMSDVESMVKNVLAAAGDQKIDRLNIVDHGDIEGMQLGSDWVDDLTLSDFKSKLRRLTGHFSSDGFVHLQHCQVGENRTLLINLARLWRVSVYAGTGYEQGVFRFNTGYYVRADPNGDFETNVGRP